MAGKNRVMVSVPRGLKTRLDKLSEEMSLAYERGQSEIRITEQGTRGEWVSLATVIERCIDEYEGHRERSRNGRKVR